MVLQGIANWLGQVDPLRKTVISQSRILLKALKQTPLNVKLVLDNRLRLVMARWLHLPNNTVPLGIPEPDLTIQSDASRAGIGFMINSAKYQMTLDESMEEYSINVLELLAIWMATLMIHQSNITENTDRQLSSTQ